MQATRYTDSMIKDYVEKGYWESTTIPEVWEQNASKFPDEEAIVDSKTRLTWAEANERINNIATALVELGIGRDKVLVSQLPNCAEFVLLYVACFKAGIINASLIRTMRHTEVERVVQITDAVAYASMREFRDFDYWEMIRSIKPGLPNLEYIFIVGDQAPEGAIPFEKLIQWKSDHSESSQKLLDERAFNAFEVARIRHTTGSTGFPKMIEETACNRIYLAKELAERAKITRDDIVGGFIQLTGGGGSYALLSAPWVGAKMVLMEHFDVESAFKTIEKERVTVAGVVPAILAMMIQHPQLGSYDLSSLRALLCHGAPLPASLAKEVEEKLGCVVVNRYGMADGGSMCFPSVEDPIEIRHMTVGRPHKGNEFIVVDENGTRMPQGQEGELLFRGPGSHAGFFNDPQRTRETYDEEGWFRTGDVGRIDENGNVIIVDRVKDLIIRGGENIYPSEIEQLLMTHPSVSNVAVVGMPDPVMGERACAYVVLKTGRRITFDEMVDFLKSKNLAVFKIPERLEIVDQFELVSDQKVDKKVLRRDIEERLKAEGKV